MTQDLENDAVSLLEQKKQEIIATSGGVYAVKEAISLHAKHVEKLRSELQELVAAGKLTTEVANFTLACVGRSSKVLSECLDSFKSRYDIKTGEALAYDNVVKKVKEKKTVTQVSAERVEVPSAVTPEVSPLPLPVVKEEASPLPKKRGGKSKKSPPPASPLPSKEPLPVTSPAKTRPDMRGKVGETVARLKQIRKNKELV